MYQSKLCQALIMIILSIWYAGHSVPRGAQLG
jgi:hypothetical protein